MLVAARRGNLLVTNSHTVADALKIAKHGDGVFVMAEAMRPSNPGVPQSNTTTLISEAEWQLCNNLGLYVYVEFPSRLPEPGSKSLSVAQTLWERVVVAAKGGLSAQLEYLDLLHPHKHVDYVAMQSEMLRGDAVVDLVLAVVAGYDSASFGLPDKNKTFPLLVRQSYGTSSKGLNLMLAATQLSHCRRRRFAPAAKWMAVVE